MVDNPVKYEQWDLLRILLVIGESPMRLSRQALGERLELGEGTMRSVLDLLKQQRLLSSTRRGHALTARGERRYRTTIAHLSPLREVRFSAYPKLINIATVLPRRSSRNVGTMERDLAVKEGAEGAVLLIKERGKLTVPVYHYGRSFAEIEEQLPVEEGGMVIIAFAKQRRIAENAVLRIAAAIDPHIWEFAYATR